MFAIRYLLVIFLVAAIVAMPVTALAADFSVNLNVSRLEDGTTCGELLFNNTVLWRVQVLSDGARPVSRSKGGNTTLISPDIVNGFFLIKIQHDSE